MMLAQAAGRAVQVHRLHVEAALKPSPSYLRRGQQVANIGPAHRDARSVAVGADIVHWIRVADVGHGSSSTFDQRPAPPYHFGHSVRLPGDQVDRSHCGWAKRGPEGMV